MAGGYQPYPAAHAQVMSHPVLPPVLRHCSEIERKTRDKLAGKDINELYEGENLVVDEAFAEGEGVVREEAAAA